ncbi:MAG: hypothetical protein JWM81_438 [Candidatus Saccharibacteria bacterium]|nr:hypothetical protein [Candidatus Saccharibacteria bacterium]
MKITKLARMGLATLVSVSSLLTLSIPLASAATKTWTGGGSDGNFSTGANWSGGTAPAAGSDLVFPYGASVTNKTAVNDLTAGTSFASVTFSGTLGVSESTYYSVTGNDITLTGGIVDSTSAGASLNVNIAFSGAQTINVGTDDYITLGGVLSGSGALTKTGAGYLYLTGANTFTGSLTLSAGVIIASTNTALGTTAGATTVNDGATLDVGSCSGPLTVAENLNLNGAGAPSERKLETGATCAGGGGGGSDVTYGVYSTSDDATTLTGAIALGADVTFGGVSKVTTITGALSGNFTFLMPTDSYGGDLVINSSANTSGIANGTYSPTASTTTLSDDLASTSVQINDKAVVTIDGKRGDVSVSSGGTLKGHGTVGVLYVGAGAILAPGNSPGCLTTGNFTLSGTLQEEIGGTDPCTGYDQVKVTGTVDVTGGTLTPSLYNGFVPKTGQSYTIIDNDGSDAVTGTFTGLDEGAAVTLGGVTYNITYKGGDGNDVVLTTAAVDAAILPKTPDTGMQLIAAHPMMAFGASAIAGLGLLIAARRLKPATRR